MSTAFNMTIPNDFPATARLNMYQPLQFHQKMTVVYFILVALVALVLCVVVFFSVLIGLLFPIAFVTDRYIIKNRDSLIQTGRRLQDRLHLPEWMRLIADEEPGMMNTVMRGTGLSFISGLLWITFSVAGACYFGPLSDEAMCALVSPLLYFGLLTWCVLLQTKRHLIGRMPSASPLVEYEGYEKQFEPTYGDPGWKGFVKMALTLSRNPRFDPQPDWLMTHGRLKTEMTTLQPLPAQYHEVKSLV